MRTQRLAAWAGITGPILFVITFVIQDRLRSDVDWVSQVVSALTTGPSGWIQQGNFVMLGVCTITFAIGLHRGIAPTPLGIAGPAILALNGVAALLAGAAFPLRVDPAGNVYDPGGHQVVGTVFFATAAIAFVCLAPRLNQDRRWKNLAPLALAAGIAGLACFVLMAALVIPDTAPLHDWAGLAQRAIVILVLLPMRVVLAARLLSISRIPATRETTSPIAA